MIYSRGERPRLPEVGDKLSAGVEPAPMTDDELEDFQVEVFSAVAALDTPPLPWSIGPGPRPANNSRLTRTLYAPDNPKQKTQSPGKDVKALKRAVSRAGFWKWQEFDHEYTNAFAHGATGPTGSGPGVDGLRAALGTLDDSGTLNERTYHALLYARVPAGPHAGEWVIDPTTEVLLEDYYAAWVEDHPPPKADEPDAPPPASTETADEKRARVRNAIADYCRRSIANEPKIHYEQARPIACFGVKPESGFTTDCSGHSTCAYYWAREVTGVAVPDPNGNGFNGYGYTGTLVNNPRCSPKYLVGDLAIYGPGTGAHVATCYDDGDGSTSRWCSHGSEAAPYAVELHYRGDLQCVVRPPLLP